MEIKLEKGGNFVADMLEKEAPKTCQKVWDALPIVCDAQHAQYSGKIIFWFAPQVKFDEIENPKLMGLYPGDLAFNCHPLHRLHLTPSLGIPLEMLIVYGGCVQGDWCGTSPVNHFARIVEGNLDELEKIGLRIRREGFEKITLTRKRHEDSSSRI